MVALLLTGEAWAQTPAKWSGVHGNEWIDYSKSFVRIGIKTKGLHKIPFSILTTDFKTKANGNYQLFHRGVEVKIIVNANEIIFYGEPNDGESDKWLFRPGPEARINPYVSFFSDEGSYILTYAEGAKRMTPAVDGTSYSGDPEPYHFQKFIKTYNDQFNYSTLATVNNPQPLNNCFYEKRNTYVSGTLLGGNNRDEVLVLDNWASNAVDLPTLEVMMHSIGSGSHNFNFSVGRTNASGDHSTILQTLSFGGIDAAKTAVFTIPAANLNQTGGILRTKSTITGDFGAQTYYILSYPQLSSMLGKSSLFMNFKASSEVSPVSLHIGITNAENDIVLYDVSDSHNPHVVQGVLEGGTYHAAVTRSQNKEVHLLAARPSGIIEVSPDMIADVMLQPSYAYPEVVNDNVVANPSDYDYLIITANTLLEEANQYALYRSSPKGGGYKVAVFEIKSLYNQFNYGEPSPVAIKRFVDFMLKDGIRSKHNLLLIGNSVTAPDIPSIPRLKKEMPGEVPSIGDPGSDFLLVAGIHGLGEDIPAIPVGRISALSGPIAGVSPDPTAVANYLAKVKKYESPTGDLTWRKNLIHLDGGKPGDNFTVDYLDKLIPFARSLDASKPIETLGTTNLTAPLRPANITEQVNNGTGMITYYGHGLVNLTQYNIGLISKENNTSTNYFTSTNGTYNGSSTNEKFPFIYFNGCGVGNVFSSRNPATIVLASDWLNVANKGAIAIIASSYNSYPGPTGIYLKLLYTELFGKTDAERKTIGMIKNEIATKIISGDFTRRTTATADDLDKNNLHIANLFGDPALKLLSTSTSPLPVGFSSIKAVVNGNQSVDILWKTAWETDNNRFVVQRSLNGIDFIDIGVVDGKGTISTESAYSFIDTKPEIGANYYRVGQIDTGGISAESFSRTVFVNWDAGRLLNLFPNPTSNYLNIDVKGAYDIKGWKLYDVSGKQVKQGGGKKVYLEDLNHGDYIIEIEMGNNEFHSRKVVKY